ncbi:MAG: hypothetical protein IPM54_41275 [Polyangiaceae bacterium]|nr:hypothetical protein [Polyangiaceae bacterium]
MALFEFELANVEDIVPWETSDGPSLNWFALTDGRFWMPVGDQVLSEYSDEIMAHWMTTVRTADYQIAAFARRMLGSAAAGAARLPERLERLASNWKRLCELREESDTADDDEASDLGYTAWNWLGERSPWASYLVANPRFHFVRVGDELRIHWDNRDRVVDGFPVWTAQFGVYAMPVESFVDECRDFARRLLREMDARIEAIEAGAVNARAALDAHALRQQHETWLTEFASYFNEYQPDIPWYDAERALEAIAKKRGLTF